VVTLNGRDIYLGRWNTQASRAEYDRLIGEWLASGRHLPSSESGLTVAELALSYWRFAKSSYRKDGQPTKTLERVRTGFRILREGYGQKTVARFGPLVLKAIQDRLVRTGLSRPYVNCLVQTIRRVFKWGVAQEMVPETVYQALTCIPGLRKGRWPQSQSPSGPIAEQVVQATLAHLPEVVADMVRLQRLTGCRPAEICILRPCDVDTSGDVSIYRPEWHKTEHHGRERVICIGPKGQDVLRPYLLREKESYCFVPAESERKRLAERHERRRTPLSCGNRPGTNRRRKPKRRPGNRYTTGSYRRAIHRAVDLANRARNGDGLLPKWSPNRLRHSAATEIRPQFGLEAAQVTLGHATADVSQIYAERDLSLAVETMRKIG
jgi:integrase